jgi:hypothetical protein
VDEFNKQHKNHIPLWQVEKFVVSTRKIHFPAIPTLLVLEISFKFIVIEQGTSHDMISVPAVHEFIIVPRNLILIIITIIEAYLSVFRR